jgi:hypothetical protein
MMGEASKGTAFLAGCLLGFIELGSRHSEKGELLLLPAFFILNFVFVFGVNHFFWAEKPRTVLQVFNKHRNFEFRRPDWAFMGREFCFIGEFLLIHFGVSRALGFPF